VTPGLCAGRQSIAAPSALAVDYERSRHGIEAGYKNKTDFLTHEAYTAGVARVKELIVTN